MRKFTCISISILMIAVSLMTSASAEEPSDLPIDDSSILSYWTLSEDQGNSSSDLASDQDLQLGSDPLEDDRDPSWKDGIKDSCLKFDGEDDIAMVSDLEFPSPEFSLSFWILTDETDPGRVILSYANVYEVNEFILEDPGDLKVHIRGISVDTSISLNDGKWHHVVITCDATTGSLRVYKDMVEDFSGILSAGAPVRTGGTFVLGNDQDEIGGGFETDQAFMGYLDEMILIDEVIGIDDVEDLYEYVLPEPEVIEKTPNRGTHPVDISINITFNVEIDLDSFQEGFAMEPPVNGTFEKIGSIISFVPDEDLENDVEYKISVSKDVVDIFGRSLDRGTEFKFRTEKVEDPPQDDDDPLDDEEAEDNDKNEDNSWKVILVLFGIIMGGVLIILILAFITRKKEGL